MSTHNGRSTLLNKFSLYGILGKQVVACPVFVAMVQPIDIRMWFHFVKQNSTVDDVWANVQPYPNKWFSA